MTDVNLVAWPDGILGHGDSQRRKKIGRLIEGGRLVRFSCSLAIFKNDNAVAFGSVRRPMVQFVPVIDRLADPDPASVIDVDARRVGKERLGGPERQF